MTMIQTIRPKLYDTKFQGILHCEANPEPWLHIAFAIDHEGDGCIIHYAIYVWDTREVVESNSLPCKADDSKRTMLDKLTYYADEPCKPRYRPLHAITVRDNMSRITGHGAMPVELINDHLFDLSSALRLINKFYHKSN